ncbi:MAG: Pectin degradation repressor protein KdgR [Lentisphaerae bacterium ADurb.Bin242]|nr:MAG: Pectin degradation repressor protein KdgR [Lentisphaerae bacterium ADurb.Bin242]
MIKVMDKTFAILEEIVISSPEPLPPLELSRRLRLNRATCSRLLKLLLDSGYILQVSRQKGYVPGPKILTLSNMAAFRKNLLAVARPVIDRCAEALQNSVQIAQLYNGKRYILYYRNCNPRRVIRLDRLSFDDLFFTATGLMLVAHREPGERMELFRRLKAEGKPFFEEFKNGKTIQKKLDSICGSEFFECRKGIQWIYAFPVFENGVFTATLGVSIPFSEYNDSYRRKIVKLMKEASREISLGVSTLHSIG